MLSLHEVCTKIRITNGGTVIAVGVCTNGVSGVVHALPSRQVADCGIAVAGIAASGDHRDAHGSNAGASRTGTRIGSPVPPRIESSNRAVNCKVSGFSLAGHMP